MKPPSTCIIIIMSCILHRRVGKLHGGKTPIKEMSVSVALHDLNPFIEHIHHPHATLNRGCVWLRGYPSND